MSFANPLGLWFLAAAIPVIALHMLKPRRVEAVVSSAMLWDDETVGSTSAIPWQRLPPTLLLLLQLLLVALFALLLADPITRTETGLTDHTVVVLDTSASMGAVDGEPDRLADAKAEAIALLDEIPRDGRVSLVTAGPTPRVRVSATTDMSAFEASIRGVRLSDGPANLTAAMTLADGLETPDAQLGIVLISDGGHTPTELAALPPGVTHLKVGTADVNHAITALTVARSETGLVATAVSEVTGGGDVSAPIRFDVDGVTQAIVEVNIVEGTPTITTVDLPDGERVIARLGGDDLLAIDNTAYAVTRSRTDLAISVHGETDPFLDALLASLPGITIVDDTVDTPELSIYIGVSVPDDIVRPFIAIAPPGGVPGVSVSGTVDNPVVAFVRATDPLLTGLDMSRLGIVAAQRVEAPTAEVLIGAEGAPLLLRGSRGGVPFLYQTFATTDSTLPLDLAFPVLGQRMVEELGGAVTVPPSLTVGDPIVPPVGRAATITAPNGTTRDRPAGAGGLVTDRPGFWTITPADGAVRTIAVSLNEIESSVDPLPVAPTDPRPVRPGEEPNSTERSWLWVLIVIALALGFAEWIWSRRSLGVPTWQWRIAGGLRIAGVAALIASLLGASIPLRSNDVATVFVLDRSDSVGSRGRSQGLNASLTAAGAAPDDALLGVVVTADGARIEQLLAPTSQSTGLATANIDGDRSDLAAGLRLAGALLPDDTKRRVVIVSDGRATSGDAEAEAEALGERGIPVDYVLLEPVSGTDAAVLSINTPTSVDEGAEVPIEVLIESTDEQPAVVTLRRDGEPVATADVLLTPGTNSVTFSDDPGSTGLWGYSVSVTTQGDVQPRNDTARTTVDIDGPAGVLLVEGTSSAGDGLVDALRSAGLEVDVVNPSAVPALDRLVGYDATVLVDVSIEQLSTEQIAAISTATRQLGRGLVTIGGPQSYGMGGYRDSDLEQVLPVLSDVLDPQRRRTVAQVMALDTSESMGECHCGAGFQDQSRLDGGVSKVAIARAGAARAIANLNDDDEIGILAIDTQERWLVELQQLPSDDVIDSGLALATPSGNTDLSGTLPAAAEALRASNAGLKHIILFTDGFTSQASLARMKEQAADIRADGITISIVATGEGAAEELRAIAEAGGGRFYPGRDLTRIPEILVQESILASRQFINEGEFLPIVTGSSQVVDTLTESPPLLGFVATTSKPTARTLLRIGPEEDPLLATWQVGLGRATSWTSDANPRWSQFWVGWDGYVDFWSSVVRDVFPVETIGAVRTTVDGDTLRIRAEAPLGQGRVNAVVTDPDGQELDVRLREINPGVFEGIVRADSAGTYAVGVLSAADGEDQIVGSSIASVSYAAEYRPGLPDVPLLARLSEMSGGRGAIEPIAAFDGAELESGRRTIRLVGLLTLLAAIAWLLAVVFSRFWLSGSRTVGAAPKKVARVQRRVRRTGRVKPHVTNGDGVESDVPETIPAFSATPEPASEPEPASVATMNELLRARREKRGE